MLKDPVRFRSAVRLAFAAGVLVLLIVAVRLNEQGARDAAVTEAAKQAYGQDLRSTEEKRRGCARTRTSRITIASADVRGWSAARDARVQTRDDPAQPNGARRQAARAVDAYTTTIAELRDELRDATELDCVAQYPLPTKP